MSKVNNKLYQCAIAVYDFGGKEYTFFVDEIKHDVLYTVEGTNDAVHIVKFIELNEGQLPVSLSRMKKLIPSNVTEDEVDELLGYKEKSKDDKCYINRDTITRAINHCKNYLYVLELPMEEEGLQEWCENYSVYKPTSEFNDYKKLVREMIGDAYKQGIIVENYIAIRNANKKKNIKNFKDFTIEELIAEIAFEYRRDYWDNGSLINYSIASKKLRELFYQVIRKQNDPFRVRVASSCSSRVKK